MPKTAESSENISENISENPISIDTIFIPKSKAEQVIEDSANETRQQVNNSAGQEMTLDASDSDGKITIPEELHEKIINIARNAKPMPCVYLQIKPQKILVN